MTWLAIRQNRVQIIGMLLFAVLLAAGLAFAAAYAASLRAELGVDSCVPLANTNLNCVQLLAEWQKRVGGLTYLFYALYVFPGVVASYVGGPLFAVEFERGTHRLAWTQSISRVRWAAVKLGIVVLVAVAGGAVLAPFGRGQQVFTGKTSPFDTFEIEGLALVSYFVFGLVAGAFIGAWSRRILTGMFIGLLVFAVVRVGVHQLRPMYQEPQTVPFPGYQSIPLVPFDRSAQIPAGAWMLGISAIDTEGREVPQERLNTLMQEWFSTSHGISTPTNNDSTFLAERGVIRRWAYQPADRFWTFQVIEAAIFVGLSLLLALLTLWRVRTRDA